MKRRFTISKFANLLIMEILSPLQGWVVFIVVSRADALCFTLSPRWGGAGRNSLSLGLS